MAFIERDAYIEHTKRVAILQQAGVAPPDEWVAVRRRLDAFMQMNNPARQQLIDAVIDPDGEDIAVLRAAAFAEVAAVPAVLHNVRTAVLDTMVELYNPVSRANYKKLSTEFDAAAVQFAKAADIVDPECPAEAMVNETQARRTAWSAAPLHAGKLDMLLPVMVAAAELCGKVIGRDERVQLPLTVDDRGVHRRKLWEAWDYKDGRCGRWSAIITVGAAIRAVDLGDLRAYRRPAPLQTKVEHHGPLTVSVTVDPEDEPQQVAIGA